MSQKKRKRSPTPTPIPSDDTIFRSTRIEDRASTFLGLYSPTLAPKPLQSLGEISSADHKIVGFRRESNQQAITGATKFVTGHDDDGERYAGKKVERVLEGMQVTGTCVVARWYGGVLLGPVRFEHIERCAREAVQEAVKAREEEKVRKKKVDMEIVEREDLVVTLRRRDESIEVLRKLAAEKELAIKVAKEEIEVERPSSQGDAKSTSVPTIDYTSMTIDRLRALDKARDATLSFLLKRIDQAEIELAQLKSQKDDAMASHEADSETKVQSHAPKDGDADHSSGSDGKTTTRPDQSQPLQTQANG